MRLATHARTDPAARARRAGAVMTLEFLLIVPIFTMVLLGIVEFYLLTTTRVILLHASRAGARTAVSGTYVNKKQANDEVRRTVHEALGTGRLTRTAKVSVTWSQDVPAKERMGEADWVHVKVDVRARSVIPDILGWVGFTLGNKTLVAGTLMKQE